MKKLVVLLLSLSEISLHTAEQAVDQPETAESDYSEFQEKVTLQGHIDHVNSVQWSPDGSQLASGSLDETIKIWNSGAATCLRTLKDDNWIWSVNWSPDGSQLASLSRDEYYNEAEFKILDLNSAQCTRTLWDPDITPYNSGGWSPDGSLILYAGIYNAIAGLSGGVITIWNNSSNEAFNILNRGITGHVFSVSWSPDGSQIASGSGDKTIKTWDPIKLRSTCLQTLSGHRDKVTSVCWSPDGSQIASGSLDKTVKIWDPRSEECIKTLTGHELVVWSVHWAQDGILASGSYDKTVKIWDQRLNQCLQTLSGHGDKVTSVCWSPDGSCLASGSYDNTIKIWTRNNIGSSDQPQEQEEPEKKEKEK